MPTGYTAKLVDGEQDFPEFVLTCARAFGALIAMRDDDLTADIPDEFEASPYHSEHLAEAQARLARVEATDLASAARAARIGHAAWRTSEAEQKARTEATLARLVAMRQRVLAWHPPTDEHTALRDFMVQQLDETIRFDGQVYTTPEPTMDGKVWRDEQIAKALRDIEYHARELAAERQRAIERTAWVRALRESLTESVPA